ncbi:MAG: bacteriohemerythrin [Burkholderiaceae bacterium]
MTTAVRERRPSVVAWSRNYALGLDEIDDQHKMLFDLINRLWGHLVDNSDAATVKSTLEDLERYTLSHFTAEETFMRVTGYANFDAHKAQHAAFVQRVMREKAAVLAGKPISFEVLTFLKDWLVDHILVADKAYADATRKREEPPKSFWRRFFG